MTAEPAEPPESAAHRASNNCVAPSSILDQRRAGVVLHVTSLPGSGRNGTLGAEAFRFIDFLSDAGFTVWQTLPINPTHADGSPYQCLSVHAGNPDLIDRQWLARREWIAREPLISDPGMNCAWLREAFEAFQGLDENHPDRNSCRQFGLDHQWWLDDYTLYMAIREECGHDPWQAWPVSLRDRWPAAVAAARRRLADTVQRYTFEQWVFHAQWGELREYARQHEIILFGDMPIFVAGDSADVWARRDYFDLKGDGSPRVVAGVPPDYFSANGQRWGNPHYDWSVMEADGFLWWQGRLRSQLELYDWVRIDHFRGFEAYWEISAESDTAIHGKWIKAPGERLLDALRRAFGLNGLPLVAEDLGIITPEVEALRDKFALPGMKILQFAFDSGPSNPYLPHNHPANSVVYTGTHDNDTTLAWFEGLDREQQLHVYDYLGCPEIPMPWAMVRCALASEARLAMVPMQDVIGLGEGYRMNTPGTAVGNWRWRFGWSQLEDEVVQRVAEWIALFGRNRAGRVGVPEASAACDVAEACRGPGSGT